MKNRERGTREPEKKETEQTNKGRGQQVFCEQQRLRTGKDMPGSTRLSCLPEIHTQLYPLLLYNVYNEKSINVRIMH